MLKLIHILNKIEDSLLVFVLSSMIILAISQIVFRNILGEGIVWIDPLLRILVLWIAMIGAIVATRTDNHIKIDIFTKYLPHKYLLLIKRLVYLITISVCLLIAWHASRFVYSEYEYGGVAFEMVPTWLTALIIPVGFFFIALRYSVLLFFPATANLDEIVMDSVIDRKNKP